MGVFLRRIPLFTFIFGIFAVLGVFATFFAFFAEKSGVRVVYLQQSLPIFKKFCSVFPLDSLLF